jgi:hypothetical protein
MQRDNNFNSPIVDAILTIGFVDYNPFTQQELKGRYSFILDYYDEIPVDSMSLGDYIEHINQKAETLYNDIMTDESFKHIFAYEVLATESFYELRLVYITDEYYPELEEISVEVYDEQEDLEDEIY